MYGLKIQKLLKKTEQLSNPKDKIKLLQEAVNIADSNNDIEWGLDLRLKLMSENLDCVNNKISFQAIGWIIGTYEEDNNIYNENDFLWQYKWMINRALNDPTLTSETVNNIIDDFSMRLKNNNYSLRPIYENYFEYYTFLGLKDEASKYLELRDAAIIDDMSDCNACEKDSYIYWCLTFEGYEKAKNEASKIFNGTLSCHRIPIITYANFTQELTKQNRLKEAENYYEKGMKHIFEDKDSIDERNFEHLLNFTYFLSKTDNNLAWKIIEKNYIKEKPDPMYDYRISESMLSILKNTSKEELNINLPEWLPIHKKENIYTKGELYDYYYSIFISYTNAIAKREGISKIITLAEEKIASF